MKKRTSMTEILSKITIYKKRIASFVISGEASNYQSLISIKKKSDNTVNGLSIDKIESDINESYQGMNDIMDNYRKLNAIKNGVNSFVKVNIAGTSMTIAEALSYNTDAVKEYYKDILAKMRNDYKAASKTYNDYNIQKFSDQAINSHLAIVLGNNGVDDAKKNQPELVASHIKNYHEIYDIEFIDPLNILDEIKKLDKWLDEFYSNFGFVLSMTNSRIIVEYDLDQADPEWKIINLDDLERLNDMECMGVDN